MEKLIVFSVVIAAALYVGRKFYHKYQQAKNPDCGGCTCDCASCDMADK